MKSPLCERPIFHHLERRVETHIFLCVLAYHLLVCIERAFLEQGIHTSWETLRRQLSTHQVVTVRRCSSAGGGGTGRRAGLKILWPRGRVGSIPPSAGTRISRRDGVRFGVPVTENLEEVH